MKTFSQKITGFNSQLDFTAPLPDGISVMNPFRENKNILPVSAAFYEKYYNDFNNRYAILGINPGRLGGGLTGVLFTDPKRLVEKCGIDYSDAVAHEPSSVFIYEMIDAYGGPSLFYQKFYINSVCPLGFTTVGKNGKAVNYNYYDTKSLEEAATGFIIESMQKQIGLGLNTDVCFCMGTGKNFKFLSKINQKHRFFDTIIPLDHPRFVVQYKSATKQSYIGKYLAALSNV